MFKSIFFVTLVALAWARPSFLHTSVVPYGFELEPTVVGHTLHSIPTAVSHQSQTIVHEKRPFLRPIIEHTPVLTTYAVPQLVSPYHDVWDGGYGALGGYGGYEGYKSVYGGWH